MKMVSGLKRNLVMSLDNIVSTNLKVFVAFTNCLMHKMKFPFHRVRNKIAHYTLF